ncbi:MAG: hypothetical protein AAB423_04140 [Patescibacteria group bacterium]
MNINLNDPGTAALVGGFFGALMTFVFSRIGDFLKSVREGKKEHHNSLIKLERLLLEHGAIVNDNIYLVTPFMEAINRGNLYWSRLSTLPIDKDIDLKLQNIDLINAFVTYQDNVRRINDDISSLQFGYSKLETAYISGDIDQKTYTINANYLSEQFLAIDVFLKNLLNDELIEISSLLRVHIKKSSTSFSQRIRRFFLKTESPQRDEIDEEKDGIKREIEESRKISKNKLKDIEKEIARNKNTN